MSVEISCGHKFTPRFGMTDEQAERILEDTVSAMIDTFGIMTAMQGGSQLMAFAYRLVFGQEQIQAHEDSHASDDAAEVQGHEGALEDAPTWPYL